MIHYILLAVAVLTAPLNVQESTKQLDLEAVHQLITRKNPELQAARESVEAARLNIQFQRLWPNPELEAELENFGGSDVFAGFDASESTILLSQSFDFAGARQSRTNEAEIALEQAINELALERTRLLGEATERFIQALADQRALEIRYQLKDNFDQFMAAMKRMENAGRIAELDLQRAELEYQSFLLSVRSFKQKRDQSLRQLTSMWNENAPADYQLLGSLEITPLLPGREAYLKALQSSPAWHKEQLAVTAATTVIETAKRERIPPLTVSFGIKNHHEIGERAFVVGAGVELPIFNSGSVAVAMAEVEVRKQAAKQSAEYLRLRTALLSLYSELVTAREIIESYNTSILSQTEGLESSIVKGYQAGKFDLMDVLDVQRTLLSSKEEYIAALTSYHLFNTKLFTLLGFPGDNTLPDPRDLISGAVE